MTQQAVAVCIGGGGTTELRTRTLASLRAHTAGEVPILELEPGSEPLAATAIDDIVLVAPGCVVADRWLEGLREAAYTSATVATATALTQHALGVATATALTQHALGSPPDADAFARAADSVRSGSLRLRPRLPPAAPPGPCVYVRRSALELVGDGEHFWPRCVERGLTHVLADDVLVLDPRPDGATSHHADEPLARAIGAAQRALHGLSVIIDARILHGPTTGTHIHLLELIAALARAERVRLTAIVPDRPNEDALARLQTLGRLSLATYSDAIGNGDIVHRPFQLSNPGDVTFLRSLGARLVLTQQDLIAFHNPAYHPTNEAWEGYRQLTRHSMAAADRVVFFSAHVRDDALAEDLVDPARASVVLLGVDHRHVAPEAPAGGAERLGGDTPAILCLGTDFHHKNRLFALRLLERLKTRHRWNGLLVLAGPTVTYGSSRPEEAQFLAGHPEVGNCVLDLGPVSEAEKEWLFARSAVVVYPSVQEGFGLVPFEAAAHGIPCLWAPGSSLSEVLPHDAAGIVPWNEERTAEHALALLQDDRARASNLELIAGAAADLTWDATAARLLDVYRAAADAPAKRAPSGDVPLTEDAARLVGPGGELPPDVHRPLLALATHPRIGRPVFGVLKLGYRASRRLGHKRK